MDVLALSRPVKMVVDKQNTGTATQFLLLLDISGVISFESSYSAAVITVETRSLLATTCCLHMNVCSVFVQMLVSVCTVCECVFVCSAPPASVQCHTEDYIKLSSTYNFPGFTINN